MSHDAFDALVASLDAPMVVVTAASGGVRDGCLVGFHSQASIGPPRYGVWLSKANRTYEVAMAATHLGVHALTEHDLPLAERFGSLTGDDVDKFAGLDVAVGDGGAPVLTACPHRMVVRRLSTFDHGGDHVCVVTEPVAVEAGGSFTPLRLSAVVGMEPGHAADDPPRLPDA